LNAYKELKKSYDHTLLRFFDVFKAGRQREDALEDLISHCWVYSGYEDCGRRKMTEEQKKLYDEVIAKQSADV